MKPLVTIAIPAFNAQKHIEQCVQSALGQTWDALEVIIVDDGSTDATLQLLKNFGSKIKIISQDHGGGSCARNRALAAASGEWIQFLDSDDYLLPDKILTQIEQASADAEVLYGEILVEENGTAPSPLCINRNADLWEQWFSWQLPQTGGALWRTQALKKIGGWNEKLACCQDNELYLRALQSGLLFKFTQGRGAVYRVWSQGTVSRKDPLQLVKVKTDLILKARDWLVKQNQWKQVYQRKAGQACFELARTLAKTDLDEAVRYYKTRQSDGLIYVHGPAAPWKYRLASALLGFKQAERLARVLRRLENR
jgi:glycosyltransferase involved in cell wall biosynthesis